MSTSDIFADMATPGFPMLYAVARHAAATGRTQREIIALLCHLAVEVPGCTQDPDIIVDITGRAMRSIGSCRMKPRGQS
jgi:hypothetical protein